MAMQAAPPQAEVVFLAGQKELSKPTTNLPFSLFLACQAPKCR